MTQTASPACWTGDTCAMTGPSPRHHGCHRPLSPPQSTCIHKNPSRRTPCTAPASQVPTNKARNKQHPEHTQRREHGAQRGCVLVSFCFVLFVATTTYDKDGVTGWFHKAPVTRNCVASEPMIVPSSAFNNTDDLSHRCFVRAVAPRHQQTNQAHPNPIQSKPNHTKPTPP